METAEASREMVRHLFAPISNDHLGTRGDYSRIAVEEVVNSSERPNRAAIVRALGEYVCNTTVILIELHPQALTYVTLLYLL